MANYLLLDTAQCLYFHKKLDKLGVRYESLFEGHPEAHFLELAPLLFELNRQEPAHQRLLKETESIGSHNPALSIIDSSADLATLARHLRHFHLVGLPNSRQLLLRWYDTRILPTWLKVMTPHQQSGFMQNVNQWQYWDRYGELKNLYWDKSVHPISPPYHIGEDQHQYLLNESQTDSVIAQMRRIIPQQIRKISYKTIHPFLEQHIKSARQLGINSIDDLVQYGLLAIYTSGHFIEHKAIAQELRRERFDNGNSFTDWALNLPDEIWSYGSPLWQETQYKKN